MKVVRENFLVFYIILIVGILIIEILFAIVTFGHSKSLIDNIFTQAADISINKIITLTEILNNSTLKLFSKFRSDLIVVGKHMSLLKDINKNLQYYKNFKENNFKNIISSNYEDIYSNEILSNFYDSQINNLNYIKEYEKISENLPNPNLILDTLINGIKHKELDLISYLNSAKSDNNIDIDDNANIFGKYLISILKSLYVGRYIIKRKNIEYLRFILFHKNECFIYPPNAYNITESYQYSKSILNSNNFPNSIYSYLNTFLGNNYFFYVIKSDSHLIVCLTISYIDEPNFSTK